MNPDDFIEYANYFTIRDRWEEKIVFYPLPEEKGDKIAVLNGHDDRWHIAMAKHQVIFRYPEVYNASLIYVQTRTGYGVYRGCWGSKTAPMGFGEAIIFPWGNRMPTIIRFGENDNMQLVLFYRMYIEILEEIYREMDERISEHNK